MLGDEVDTTGVDVSAHDADVLVTDLLAGLVCSAELSSALTGSLLVRLRRSLTLIQHEQFFFTLVRTDVRRFVLVPPPSKTNKQKKRNKKQKNQSK